MKNKPYICRCIVIWRNPERTVTANQKRYYAYSCTRHLKPLDLHDLYHSLDHI